MRASWRLLRLVLTTLAYTAYLAWSVRRRAPAERPAYRARRQQVGCVRLCRILNVHLRVAGMPPPRDGPTLLVTNHLGVLDPLVLATALPVAIVAKAEMARWPVVGWVCRTHGVLFVERGRPSASGALVAEMQATLAAGVPVLVFPEGTTSRGPGVLPFKTGAFEVVAGQPEARVVPGYLHPVRIGAVPARGAEWDRVTWADTDDGFLHHFWKLMSLPRVEMHLAIGPPVPAKGKDRKALARQLQEAVLGLARQAGARKEADPSVV